MIRINLIPTKRKKKAKPVATYLVVAVLVTVASLAIAFFANSYMNSQIKDLKDQQAANDAKIKALEAKIAEVKNFEALNKRFTDRKAVIEELTKNQSLPVRMLDELSIRLQESVWLTSLTIRNNKVNLSGLGFSPNDVVDYVQSMKESELFTGVVLHSTNKVKSGDVDTFVFQISFTVQG